MDEEIKYLGGEPVSVEDTPFKDYTPTDWALEYIMRYGGIAGVNHKTWVLDQVARILNGAELTLELHKWSNGYTEYRFDFTPTLKYYQWVENCREGEDGPNTYNYDCGIAP